MEVAKESVILGTLSEKELDVFKSTLNQINHTKFRIGDLETAKHNALKEIDELKYTLKVAEEKVAKKYGADAVINIQTGEISAPQKPGALLSK